MLKNKFEVRERERERERERREKKGEKVKRRGNRDKILCH